jgi:hypothetical protein
VGSALADLDADGDLDLVVVNGHIYPQVDAHPEHGLAYRQTPLLLENRGGRFVDVSAQAGPGFTTARAGRGLAVGDVDDDGDLDLLMSQLDGPPVLLRNDSRGGDWLIVPARCRRSPAAARHARDRHRGRPQPVTRHRLGRQLREQHDRGCTSASARCRAHGGRVRVRWTDGSESVLRDVPARQVLAVRKP